MPVATAPTIKITVQMASPPRYRWASSARIPGLLGRRRNHIEADVQKNNAGALVIPATHRSLNHHNSRIDLRGAHHDDGQLHEDFTTTMMFARTLARTPIKSSTVTNSTMSAAGMLK